MATATAKKPTSAQLKKALEQVAPSVNPQAKARSEKLLLALKELGTGKNKIAESLKAKKIRGTMGSTEDCPVAVFVKKLFPKAIDIDVNSDTIEVSFEKSEFNFEVDTPKLIGQFIDGFDGEKYPDLLKK